MMTEMFILSNLFFERLFFFYNLKNNIIDHGSRRFSYTYTLNKKQNVSWPICHQERDIFISGYKDSSLELN